MQDRSRVLPTTGIHNFRDYGGYRVANGGRLLCGRLYRSGEFAKASDEDLNLVSTIDLAAVVDLRGAEERRAAPGRFPVGFAAPILHVEGETVHSHAAPHVEAAGDALNANDARARMLRGYSSMPFRPLLVEMYRRYFRTLAEADGATVVFCTAGKDRTGLAVALLHHAIGVHWDDILEDYMLTNSAGDQEARISAIRQDLDQRFAAQLSDEAIAVVTSVEPQYLERAFEEIVRCHGSVDAYLADQLQVAPITRAQLSKRFLQ